MTHFYDSSDYDCFACDNCGNEIIDFDEIYNENKENLDNPKADEMHYCYDCTFGEE